MAEPQALPRERSDLSVLGVSAGAGVVLAGIAIAVLVPWLVLANVQAPARAPNDARPPRTPGPGLQTAGPLELRAFLRGKRARLESSGVDAEGHAHIAIEEAMGLMVARDAGQRR